MNKYVLPIGLLVLSILSFSGAAALGKKDTFEDSKSKADCDTHNKNLKDGAECGAWGDDICYRGKFSTKDGSCTKNVDVLGVLAILAAFTFFVAFVVTLIVAIRRKR